MSSSRNTTTSIPNDNDDMIWNDDDYIEQLIALDQQIHQQMTDEDKNMQDEYQYHDAYLEQQQELEAQIAERDKEQEQYYNSLQLKNQQQQQQQQQQPINHAAPTIVMPTPLFKAGYRRISQVYNDSNPDLQRGCESCGSLHNVLHERYHENFQIVVCTNCVFCEETQPPQILPYINEHGIYQIDPGQQQQQHDHQVQSDPTKDPRYKLYYNPQHIHPQHADILEVPLNKRYNTINKTLVRELYILTERDLAPLRFISVKNPWSRDKQNGNQQQQQQQRYRNQQPELQLSLSTMKLYLNLHCLDLALNKHGSLAQIKKIKNDKQQKILEKEILQRAQEEREKEIILLCKQQGMSKDMIYMKLLAEQQIMKRQAKERIKNAKLAENAIKIRGALRNAEEIVTSSSSSNDTDTENSSDENDNSDNDNLKKENKKKIKEITQIKQQLANQNNINNKQPEKSDYVTEEDLIMSWFSIPGQPRQAEVDNKDQKESHQDDNNTKPSKVAKKRKMKDEIVIDDGDDDQDSVINGNNKKPSTNKRKTNNNKKQKNNNQLDDDDEDDIVQIGNDEPSVPKVRRGRPKSDSKENKPTKTPATKKSQAILVDSDEEEDQQQTTTTTTTTTKRSRSIKKSKFIVSSDDTSENQSNNNIDDDSDDDIKIPNSNKKTKNTRSKHIDKVKRDNGDSDDDDDSDDFIVPASTQSISSKSTKSKSTTTTRNKIDTKTEKNKKKNEKSVKKSNKDNTDDIEADEIDYSLVFKKVDKKKDAKKSTQKNVTMVIDDVSEIHQHHYVEIEPGVERCSCGAELDFIAL